MAVVVELLPDDALDAAVRDRWRRLAAAGLPGLADHAHATNRPHLTTWRTDVLDDAARARAAGLVAAALPLEVRTAGLLLFPGRRWTLALPLAPAAALLAVRDRLVAALGPDAAATHWQPHLSLALRLRPEQVGPALAAVTADDGPGADVLAGRLVAARTYDTDTREVAPLG